MSSVFRLTFAFSNSLGLATHDTNGINPTNVDRERDLFARRGEETILVILPRRERKLIPFGGRRSGHPSGNEKSRGVEAIRRRDAVPLFLLLSLVSFKMENQRSLALLSPHFSGHHRLFYSTISFIGPPQTFSRKKGESRNLEEERFRKLIGRNASSKRD